MRLEPERGDPLVSARRRAPAALAPAALPPPPLGRMPPRITVDNNKQRIAAPRPSRPSAAAARIAPGRSGRHSQGSAAPQQAPRMQS